MPELDPLIAAWRARLARELGPREEVLDELEAHVRDGAEALMKAGVPSDEALRRTLRSFGESEVVAGEFHLLRAPSFFALGGRASSGLAYTAGAVALVGFLLYLSLCVADFLKLLRASAVPLDPRWSGFRLGVAVALTMACFTVLRASRRFLARPNERDFRGVVAFSLLVAWIATALVIQRLPIPYPVNLALLLLCLGGLTMLWRHCVAHRPSRPLTSP